MRLWHRSTLELAHVFTGHNGPVNAIDLSHSSERIISASGDGTLILWDIRTRRFIRKFSGHSRGLACVAFVGSSSARRSPYDFHHSSHTTAEEDELIVSGSNDKTIRIWRASTGECVCMLEGHEDLVRALAYDALSGRLISASYDQTVIIWQLKRTRPDSLVTSLGEESTDEDAGNRENMNEQRMLDVITATKQRQLKGFHTSYIFDVKFDLGRIIRQVPLPLLTGN